MSSANYVPVLDAVKIYVQKPERRVRFWFLLLFLVFAASSLLTFADSDFSAFLNAAQEFLRGEGSMPVFSREQLNYLALYLLAQLIAVWASSDYLAVYLNKEGDKSRLKPAVLFRIYLYHLILGSVFLFSSPFFLIPYFFFYVIFYFLPAELVSEGNSIPLAMQRAYQLSRGLRLSIVVNILFLFAILNVAQTLFGLFVGDNPVAVALLGAFFFAWRALARARLAGILYDARTSADRSSAPFSL